MYQSFTIWPTAMMDMLYRPGSKTAWFLTVAALLLALPACGRQAVLGRVHGKVTFQHKPVPRGFIVFSNDTNGVHMTARLQPDGTYEVSMVSGRGLPLGTYQVAVTVPLVDEADKPKTLDAPPRWKVGNLASMVPPRYNRPETSGLTLTVHEGDNVYDVDLQP